MFNSQINKSNQNEKKSVTELAKEMKRPNYLKYQEQLKSIRLK